MEFTSNVHAHHPLEADLLALQRSLSHLSNTPPTSEISNPGVQIEGDCLVLITTIKNSGHLTWDMMPLWKQTMNMLSTMASWTVHYCRRSANRVADMLAHYTIPAGAGELAQLPLAINEVIDEEKLRATSYTNSFFNQAVGGREGQLSAMLLQIGGSDRTRP